MLEDQKTSCIFAVRIVIVRNLFGATPSFSARLGSVA